VTKNGTVVSSTKVPFKLEGGEGRKEGANTELASSEKNRFKSMGCSMSEVVKSSDLGQN
jgi:hypothetical protein